MTVSSVNRVPKVTKHTAYTGFFSTFSTVAVIAFEQTLYNFSEDSMPSEVCIVVENGVTLEVNVSVTVRTVAGTALSDDFGSIKSNFSFMSSRACFGVSVLLDGLLEEAETFNITLESMNERLFVSIPQAEIEIADANSKLILTLSYTVLASTPLVYD